MLFFIYEKFNKINYYYLYSRGGGNWDEVGMDMRFEEITFFFVFLGSKSKFLLS